jgi:predicted PurR-regulated permease PerM
VFATAAILSIIALINIAILMLAAPVSEWIAKAPDIRATVSEKLEILDKPLAALREIQSAVTAPLKKDQASLKVDVTQNDIVAPIVAALTPAIGELVLFFGTLFFQLLSRTRQRKFLVSLFGSQDARLRVLRILNDIEVNLARYVGVVSVINLGVGLATAIIAYSFGLPNVALWAMLAFVLNFVPYVGPVIMFLVLFVISLISLPTLTHALAPPLVFALFTVIEGHLVTPSIIGRQLALNPLAVFLCLAFWMWLWGPAGAFLAVPLLVVGLVTFDHLYPRHNVNLPE